MSWLGLDIGTSGCKAAVFDDTGRRLGYAYRGYATLHPGPGLAELNAVEVVELARTVVAEAAASAAADGAPVRALAVSSQGEAMTPVNAAGMPLAHAQVSSDVRAMSIVAEWADLRERVYTITGHTAHPMFSLFKLIWLRRHAPEVHRAAIAFHCFEDLVHRHLGVLPAMGWSLAGRTLLFDVRQHRWDDDLCAAAGVDPSRLARPLPPGSEVGVVTGHWAREWGLPDGVRVIAGGHDQTLATLGAGVVRSGMAMYATGTVECIAPVCSRGVWSPQLREANLCTYAAAVPGAWTTVAFSLTGGNLLDWFRREFAPGSDYDELLTLIDRPPSTLLVLPYFTASGTPYFDAATPGAVIGMRLSTSRGELLRGLLEGVVLEMRLNLDLLAAAGIVVDTLRATGGGSRNAVWNQLKADVLGRPIAAVAEPESGCLGGAILAAATVIGEAPDDVAHRWVQVGRTYLPDPQRALTYDGVFARYRKLYPVLNDLHHAEETPP